LAEARLVRFRAEWVAELLADPEPGDRVTVPFRELVVREVSRASGETVSPADARGEPVHGARPGWAHEYELQGADALAEVGPHLVAPGATWRATARLSVLGTLRKGDPSWYPVSGLERDATTLDEALDAVLDWAEEWVSGDPPLEERGVGATRLSGYAELRCVEPRAPSYGRSVLRVSLGAEFGEPFNPDGALAALQALCAEAERLYGAAEPVAETRGAVRKGPGEIRKAARGRPRLR
jgi:hypothetical protein